MVPKSNEIILDSGNLNEIDALKNRIDILENRIEQLTEKLDSVSLNYKVKNVSNLIAGEFIGVINEKIVGWAVNQLDPKGSVTISAYYQNKLITTMVANEILTEVDIPNNGYGHGFRLVLPPQFYDGKERVIRLKVDEFEYELPFSPAKVILGNSYPIEGEFEGAEDGYLRGWVIDHSEPFNTMEIMVFYNQRLVAKSLADVKRGDLSEKLGTNVYHGFKVKLPSQYYDGRPRRFGIKVSPWACKIENSPQTISFLE